MTSWARRAASGRSDELLTQGRRSRTALRRVGRLSRVAGLVAVFAVAVSAVRAESLPALVAAPGPPPDPAAEGFDARTLKARSWALQVGASERSTALTAAVNWELPWRRLSNPPWRAYLEASVAGWRAQSPHPGEPERFWRVGLTPVLRYAGPHPASRWFVEAGVGFNLIGPLYRSGDRRFGSAFNFGDHLAIGWKPEPQGHQEVSLRLQHFSNAGLRSPNPGENFLQLRVAWLY